MHDIDMLRGQLASQVLASGLYTQALRNQTVSATVDDYNSAPALWSELANTCSITLDHSTRQIYKDALLVHLVEQMKRLFSTAYVGPFCDFPSTDSSCSQAMVRVPGRKFPFIKHMDLVSSPQEGLQFDLDDFVER
jgi:hypothetical protein